MSAERLDVIDGDLREQRKTVTEQGQILAVLASSIGEIKSYMKESIEIQREQAVLFEKFANHEEQNDGDHRHIHQRIDIIVSDIKEMKKTHSDTCLLVQPMAEKGARIHGGMVMAAKTIGISILVMLFGLTIWAIKASDYTPNK